ncbi:ABC transporter transmembrane region-domain-containing protein [Obelidium mucronatum]|nr:ABC transporter transmembrane region-domain-containing protein [Obelidium mucronatum]
MTKPATVVVEDSTDRSLPDGSSKGADALLPAKKGFFTRKPKGEPKPKEPAVSMLSLFRFADTTDKLMIAVALVCSIANGALVPAAILILGDVLGSAGAAMQPGGQLAQLPPGVAMPAFDPSPMYPLILNFVYFGFALWVLAGENQGRRIRELYLRSILRQDLGWFDLAEEGSLTTRLAQDTNLIQDGISEKFGLVIQSVAQFLTGFVIAFYKGPTLALVLLAAVPVMAGVGITMFSALSKLTTQGQDAYAEAGAVAEQVISGIRTVYSFSLQARFAEKYDTKLDRAEKSDQRRGITLGIGFGSFMLVMFSTYGLAFWYGSRLVVQGKMGGQDVLVTFLSLMMGSFALMMLPPNLAAGWKCPWCCLQDLLNN